MDSKPMTSQSLDIENHNLPQSSFSKKKALFLSATLVLAVAAIVGACALALVFTPARDGMASSQGLNPMDLSLEEKEKLHSQVVANNEMATIARRERRVQKRPIQSYCRSNISNDTIPVAHITGISTNNGIQWSDRLSPRIVPGKSIMQFYRTRWECDHSHDLVDGGMNFSKETQELIVPTCGFYHFSSQILFQYPSTDQMSDDDDDDDSNSYVQHSVEITPNCDSTASFTRSSFANQEKKRYHRASTYLSDVVKMCKGGTFKILIPVKKNICCAHGDFLNTFFSSFLIQKTKC